MITALDQKIQSITPPGAIIDNAALTTAPIDTKGYDWCDLFVMLGATDIAMAALKLQESDDNATYTDVPGADFATGTQPDGTAAALPSATQDNTFFAFRVKLNARMRYLDLVATGGDGTAGAYITAFAVLSRAKELPNTSAERGLTGEIIV